MDSDVMMATYEFLLDKGLISSLKYPSIEVMYT